MDYKQLGKTDLTVSALGFGCSAIGGVFDKVSLDKAIETVHKAIDMGINYLDTSPYYGNLLSEINTGLALKEIPRDKYYLATKAGKYGDDISDYDYSYERIIRSCDESLKRLKVDYLDVLQLHDYEYHGGIHIKQVIEEGIPALNTLKQQGKIRYSGITAYPVDAFKKVIDHEMVDIILSHNHYSLNDQRLVDILPYMKEKGIGIVSASPLASGLLTSKGVPEWHTATAAERRVVEKAIAFCKENNTSIEKIAIQFAIQNKDIPTVLVSSSNPGRMEKNIEWANAPYDASLTEAIIELLKPIANTDWGWG